MYVSVVVTTVSGREHHGEPVDVVSAGYPAMLKAVKETIAQYRPSNAGHVTVEHADGATVIPLSQVESIRVVTS